MRSAGRFNTAQIDQLSQASLMGVSIADFGLFPSFHLAEAGWSSGIIQGTDVKESCGF